MLALYGVALRESQAHVESQLGALVLLPHGPGVGAGVGGGVGAGVASHQYPVSCSRRRAKL